MPSEVTGNRAARIAALAFAVMSLASLGCTLSWALLTIFVRPLDGVEGEVIFEAMRLHEKRALYIDPWVGDLSYGAPPTRYFVLYPPLFSSLFSLLPLREVASYTLSTRALSLAAWSTAVLLVVRARRHGTKAERAFVGACGAWVLGMYVLGLYGASGRPDALAIFLATVAVVRSTQKGKVDAVAAVLFALAAFTKPNVIGLGAGALIGSVLRHKFGAWRGAASFVVATAGVFCALSVASDGRFLSHLLTSTAQPASFPQWTSQMTSRLPFFLVPLALAGWLGLRHRKQDGMFVALVALVASTSWALLSLAKIGSASNYWMEPCIAALVIVARAPTISLGARTPMAALVLALQTPYAAVANVRSSVEAIASARDTSAALERIRASCNDLPNAVTIADEPGVELTLDGRIIGTPFQFTHLTKKDPGFADVWARDLVSSAVRCLVMQNDLLERGAAFDGPAGDGQRRAGTTNDDGDRFPAPVRRALKAHFALDKTDAGLYIYRLR